MVAASICPMDPAPAEPVPVLLVRHGEQVREGDDGPLTPRGEQQARHLADALRLQGVDSLVSSSLRRAVATARALGREPRPVADLDEFRFGPGWSWDAAGERQDLALWRPEHRAGDESLGAFEERVGSALESELDPYVGGRLIVVVHSGVIDALVRWALGATGNPWLGEVAVGHASVTELAVWPSGMLGGNGAPRHTEIRRLGEVGHLPEELRTGQ